MLSVEIERTCFPYTIVNKKLVLIVLLFVLPF